MCGGQVYNQMDQQKENTPSNIEPIKEGTINLENIPIIKNQEGQTITLRNIIMPLDEGAALIPTIVGDTIVSEESAIQHYQSTGEHLGIFRTVDDANLYSDQLGLEREGV